MRILIVVFALACVALSACGDDLEPHSQPDVGLDGFDAVDGTSDGATLPDTDAPDANTADTGGDAELDAMDGGDVPPDAAEDTSLGDASDGGSDTSPGVREDLCLEPEDAYRLVHVLPIEPLGRAYTCARECAGTEDDACAAECLAADTALSLPCAGCFVRSAECGADACATQCEREGSACNTCLMGHCTTARRDCVGAVKEVAGSRAPRFNAINLSPDLDPSVWVPGFSAAILPSVGFLDLVRGLIPVSDEVTAFDFRGPDAEVDDLPVAAVQAERPTAPNEVVTIALYGSEAAGTLGGYLRRESRDAPSTGARYRVFHAADSERSATMDVWNQVEGERGWMYDDMPFGTVSPDSTRDAGTFALGIDLTDDDEMEAIFDIELRAGSQHTFWIVLVDEELMLLDTTATGDRTLIAPREP